MESLHILRMLLANLSPGAMPNVQLFPARELRFVLEYGAPPDMADQRLRLSLLLGEGGFKLEFLSESPALASFALLRFPGIERTLPQRDLFAIGYALADALTLVSAEPDLGTDCYADPQPDVAGVHVESASMLSGLCWVAGPEPANRLWAVENIGAVAAWARSRGEGIVVAQPDTGVATHDEIDSSMLALDHAADILDGDPDPEDPLAPGMANPGHGTGTASVLASRVAGSISGAAPLARVAPIRCIEDVKVFDASPVAVAIAHATKVGCHIISMSLGGVPSRALHAAVRAAVAADLIVLAAAGNCVRTVVWPARYDEVIAVGGSNVQDMPWKGTCRGPAVQISAPAEFVWRAHRTRPADPLSGVSGGQGTSFAVALVAGCAALWLSRFGRHAVIAEARSRGTSVQALFRHALRATARRPDQWDTAAFGAGIVDANALLSMDLAAIPQGSPEGAPVSAQSVKQLLDEEIGSGAVDQAFPWCRYELEIAAIALAHAKLGQKVATMSAEAKVMATRPSPELAAAADGSSDLRLRGFSERSGHASLSRPLAIADVDLDPRRLQLAIPKSEGLESAGGEVSIEQARDYFLGAGRVRQMARLESVLSAQPDASMRSRMLDEADAAMTAITRGDRLAGGARMGLEALIMLTGRPVLRVRNDSVNLNDPRASDWKARLQLLVLNQQFVDRLKSVGRIDADGMHVGTGFVVGKGLVLTNRHVLQAFAAPVPRRNNPMRWILTQDNVTIDFADDPSVDAPQSRFRVTGIVGAGASEILDDLLDFTRLDAALLEVESVNAMGAPLPAPTMLMGASKGTARRDEIFVVGYPARPATLPTKPDGDIDLEVAKRLNALFGTDYGTKYLSPGSVVRAPGVLAGDSEKWTLTHDATTLGGNSGSCVIGFTDPIGVVGLHFGGAWLRENYAHAVAALRRESNFLTNPALNWKMPQDGPPHA